MRPTVYNGNTVSDQRQTLVSDNLLPNIIRAGGRKERMVRPKKMRARSAQMFKICIIH